MNKLLVTLALSLWSVFAFAAVNLNTATQAELEALPGIGPVKAKAILDDRAKSGPFKSVDDLNRVTGIGKATVDKLRPDITVSGATSAPKAAPAASKATMPVKVADTAKKDDAKSAMAGTADGRSAKKDAQAKPAAAKDAAKDQQKRESAGNKAEKNEAPSPK